MERIQLTYLNETIRSHLHMCCTLGRVTSHPVLSAIYRYKPDLTVETSTCGLSKCRRKKLSRYAYIHNTNIHTYIPIYLHTFVHTYIHTHTGLYYLPSLFSISNLPQKLVLRKYLIFSWLVCMSFCGRMIHDELGCGRNGLCLVLGYYSSI